MFFIVLEHLLINGCSFFQNPTGYQYQIANMIMGFTIVGVNCFLLITGYYGLSFKWKSIIKLYLTCAFYEFIGYLIHWGISGTTLTISDLGNIIFPLSHSNLWYIRCYVMLLFVSPILNAGLQTMSKSQYQKALLLLLVVNLYFGWFWKHDNYNANGYNISQFVFVYIIGGYIRRYFPLNAQYKRRYILLFLTGGFVWGVLQNINDTIHSVPHLNGWSYSNPIVIISAIGLFLYFRELKFHSKFVNLLAPGTFAVYIFHCGRNTEFLYQTCSQLVYATTNSAYQVGILSCSAFVILFTICLLDIPQQQSNKWVINRLSR